MTDLEELSELFDKPEGIDLDAASNRVAGFLYHVIPHLNAAGRLLVGHVPDGFATEAERTSHESND